MTLLPRSPSRLRGGFTLIEVIGAFVIFAVGVLAVVRLTSVGGTQMRYAGIASELAVRAAERLDSLEAEPFASLAAGAETDTLTVSGLAYTRTVTVTVLTPLLARIDVSLSPSDGAGPSHAGSTFVSERW